MGLETKRMEDAMGPAAGAARRQGSCTSATDAAHKGAAQQKGVPAHIQAEVLPSPQEYVPSAAAPVSAMLRPPRTCAWGRGALAAAPESAAAASSGAAASPVCSSTSNAASKLFRAAQAREAARKKREELVRDAFEKAAEAQRAAEVAVQLQNRVSPDGRRSGADGRSPLVQGSTTQGPAAAPAAPWAAQARAMPTLQADPGPMTNHDA